MITCVMVSMIKLINCVQLINYLPIIYSMDGLMVSLFFFLYLVNAIDSVAQCKNFLEFEILELRIIIRMLCLEMIFFLKKPFYKFFLK